MVDGNDLYNFPVSGIFGVMKSMLGYLVPGTRGTGLVILDPNATNPIPFYQLTARGLAFGRGTPDGDVIAIGYSGMYLSLSLLICGK